MPTSFVARGTDGYEASMGRWSRKLAAPFIEFSGVPAAGRVLDAGCGTGSLTLALAADPRLRSIEALDIEDDFVAALRERTSDPRIRVQKGDVCALPFGDREFDGAYSLLVLHFVPDPRLAVRELRRVLRPGGVAAAAVWAYGGMPSWRLFWDVVLAQESDAARQGVIPAKRPMTGEGELLDAFARAGFADVVETALTIDMDYAGFDDFWQPMVYGQGKFAAFFDALPQGRRDRLLEALSAAYRTGAGDGPRRYPGLARAVRATA